MRWSLKINSQGIHLVQKEMFIYQQQLKIVKHVMSILWNNYTIYLSYTSQICCQILQLHHVMRARWRSNQKFILKGVYKKQPPQNQFPSRLEASQIPHVCPYMATALLDKLTTSALLFWRCSCRTVVLSSIHVCVLVAWSKPVHLVVLMFSCPTVLRISNAKEATATSAWELGIKTSNIY